MADNENIKKIREQIKLKLESNELEKYSRDLYAKGLEDLDKKNAKETEYQSLLKQTKVALDAVSRSADYVAQSFFDSVNDLTKTNKILVEQRQNLNKLSRTARDLLDIRSGEATVNDKILKKKREEIRLGLRNLKFLKQAAKGDEAKQKELQDQINAVKELEGVYNSIQTTVDKTNKSLGAIPAVAAGIDSALQKAGLPALGLADALEKTHMAAQEAEQIGGEAASQFDAMGNFAGNVKDNLMEALTPANLIQFAFVEIVGAMVSMDAQTAKIAKNFGISYTQAGGINEEMTDAAAQSYILSITTKDLGDAFVAINNQFGTFASLSEETLETFSRLTEEAGFSQEAVLALNRNTYLTNQTLEESSAEVMGQVAAFNAMNGTAFNQKEIMEGIAKASAATVLSLGGSSDELAKAVMAAKSLGLELSELENIANSLVQFESSISNELEAELLIGRDLNLEKARLLALNNDIAGAAEEIASQIGSSADFTKMNRIQQEALAKAVGMTRDSLADSLIQQEVFNQLSGVAGDTAKERFDNLVKEVGLEEAKKRIGDENLANSMASESIQERFTNSIEKAKEIFVVIGEALLPIVSVITDVVGGIATFISKFSGVIKVATKAYLIFKGIQLTMKGIVATTKLINAIRAKGYAQAKLAQLLNKAGLVTDKQKSTFAGRITYFKNKEAGLNKVNLITEKASLVNVLKKGILEKKNTFQKSFQNALGKTEIAQEGIIQTFKKRGFLLGIKDIAQRGIKLALATATAIAEVTGTSVATLGIAAAVGLAAAGGIIAMLNSKKSQAVQANDLFSPGDGSNGYGKRTLLSPEGTFSLNNKDSIIAGTNLTPPPPSTSQAVVNAEQRKTNMLLERLVSKESNVYMDSDKVGMAFAKNG